MRSSWPLFAALLLTLARPAAADEPPEPVAVLSVEIAGDAAPELRSQIAKSIDEGLASAGAATVAPAEVKKRLSGQPELVGCFSTTCLDRLGELLGALSFIRATVKVTGADYSIHLDLLRPTDDSGPIRQVDESCSVCTISDFSALASRAATTLWTATSDGARVVIATSPPGATLEIDGAAAGEAPYSGLLAPGSHRVVARLDGRIDADETIEVASQADDAQNFQLDLAPATSILPPPPAPIDEPRPRRPLRYWKWATVAGAAVALVAGVTLLSIDGDPTCSDAPVAQCPRHYQTMTSGLLSTGAGIGLGAAGTWMFLRDAEHSRYHPDGSNRTAIGASWSTRF